MQIQIYLFGGARRRLSQPHATRISAQGLCPDPVYLFELYSVKNLSLHCLFHVTMKIYSYFYFNIARDVTVLVIFVDSIMLWGPSRHLESSTAAK